MNPENFQKLEIVRLTPDAKLPTRAHHDDAGLDLYGLEDFILEPGQSKIAKTGIAMKLEKGMVGLVADRSSMGKRGIKTAGGVIDAGYRGEIGVILMNLSPETFTIRKHDRIAQLLILPIATPEPVEVETLEESKRGLGGFGSTGK